MLAAFTVCPSLAGVSDFGLGQLCSLTGLTALNLAATGITLTDATVLQALSSLARLARLRLDRWAGQSSSCMQGSVAAAGMGVDMYRVEVHVWPPGVVSACVCLRMRCDCSHCSRGRHVQRQQDRQPKHRSNPVRRTQLWYCNSVAV
jgi:hypothetical protein